MEKSFRRYSISHGKVCEPADVEWVDRANRVGDCRALCATRPDTQACAATLRGRVEVTVN
jgi:hypothetical protein